MINIGCTLICFFFCIFAFRVINCNVFNVFNSFVESLTLNLKVKFNLIAYHSIGWLLVFNFNFATLANHDLQDY